MSANHPLTLVVNFQATYFNMPETVKVSEEDLKFQHQVNLRKKIAALFTGLLLKNEYMWMYVGMEWKDII